MTTIYDRHHITPNAPLTGTEVYEDYNSTYSTNEWSIGLPARMETQGQNINNFHARVKAGDLLPHTSFLQTECSASIVPGSYSMSRPGTSVWATLTESDFLLAPTVVIPDPDLSGVGAELQRAAARIMSKGFDAMTFMAEYHKTVSMFKRVSRNLHDLLDDIVKARKNVARRLYRLYLEGQYGWRILAYDIKSLHEALVELDFKRKIWSERSGYTYTDDLSDSGASFFGSSWGDLEWSHTTTVNYSLRGSVSALVQPAQFQANPFQTAWEVIPLSFVIDWLLTVGNSLQAMNLVLNAQKVYASTGWKGHLRETRTTGGFINTPAAYSASTTVNGLTTISLVTVKRDPASVPLSPQVSQRVIRPSQILDLTAIYQSKASLPDVLRLR